MILTVFCVLCLCVGGLACLDDEGLKEINTLIDYYLENARILRQTFLDLGYKVYGGVDAPYVFVDMGGKKSWVSNIIWLSILMLTLCCDEYFE